MVWSRRALASVLLLGAIVALAVLPAAAVASGASSAASAGVAAQENGNETPAFVVESIEAPDAVDAGVDYEVGVTVANTGVPERVEPVSVDVGAGDCSDDFRTVTLEPGASSTVTLHCSAPSDEAGAVTIRASTDAHEQTTAVDVAPHGGATEWHASIAAGGSSPTIAGGTVYVGGQDGLYAVDADTGEVRWNRPTGDRVQSSPSMVNGTVYAGSDDGSLHAVDADTGTEQWSRSLGDAVETSPTATNASGGTVYVATGPTLFALDAATGEERWNHSLGDQVRYSPAVANGTVFVAGDGELAALDGETGDELWRTAVDGEDVTTAPTVANGTAYVGSAPGKLHAIDAASGEVQWTSSVGLEFARTPTVFGGVVYVGSSGFGGSGALHAVDARTGEERWRFGTPGPVSSSPTVADGSVVVGSYSGDREGRTLWSLDADSGRAQWGALPGNAISTSPTVADGTVYVGAGGLYAVDAGVNGSSEGSRVRLGTIGGVADRSSPDGRIVVESVESPEEIDPGATFRTNVTVTNDGLAAWTDTVAVESSHGSCAPDSASLHLDAGASETVALECSVPRDAAGATVSVTASTSADETVSTTTDVGYERELEWAAATGGEVRSSPTVANGTLYVGSDDGTIYAFDERTGAERWNHSTGDRVRASPTVANGTVYAGSHDGTLYALDAESGAERWSVATGRVIRTSPTASDRRVFVGADDGNVYAFDAESGAERWRYATGEPVSTAPAVSNDSVYVGSRGGNLHALDARTGEERWSVWLADSVGAAPTVANGTIYVDAGGDRYALDEATGHARWTDSTVRGGTTPTVADGTVYFGSRDGLHAYGADGEERWTLLTGGSVGSSPTVAGGSDAASSGTVFAGAADSNLYAVAADSGEERWNVTTEDRIASSPTVANGTVYVGSDDGSVYAFDAGVNGSSEGSRASLGTLGHVGDRAAAWDDPPGLVVEDVALPDAVDPGSEFEVAATVASDRAGEPADGSLSIESDAGDCAPATEAVSVGPGASRTVEFACAAPSDAVGDAVSIELSTGDDATTVSVPVAADEAAAEFEVVDVELSRVPDGLHLPVVERGDDYRLSATIRNEGDARGTRSVAHVSDAPCTNFDATGEYGDATGEYGDATGEYDERSLELDPGAERTVWFVCDLPFDVEFGDQEELPIRPGVAIDGEDAERTVVRAHEHVPELEPGEFVLSEPHTDSDVRIEGAAEQTSPTVGEAVPIEVELYNDGSPARQNVTLVADGETVDEAAVELNRFADGVATLSYTPTAEDVGTERLTVATGDDERTVAIDVRPQSFDVALSPGRDAVLPDATALPVEVTVTNPGSVAVEEPLSLSVAGSEAANATVQVPANATETVTLEAPVDLAPGEDLDLVVEGATASDAHTATVLERPNVTFGEHEPAAHGADGRYRDATGDGNLSQTDVVTFFRYQHRQAVKDAGAFFDFTGDGTVGHGDVVALFEAVATR